MNRRCSINSSNNKSQQIIVSIASDQHFYIRTQINGVTIKFLIDTGASDVVLSSTDAKKIGINLKKLKFTKQYNTANGTVFGANIRLKRMRIGTSKLKICQHP